MLFHSLINNHFEYSAIFSIQIYPPILLSLEKHVNWELKSVYFRSSFKSLSDLREKKKKNVYSINLPSVLSFIILLRSGSHYRSTVILERH